MENKSSQRSRPKTKQRPYSATQEPSRDKKTAFGPRYYSVNDAEDVADNNKRLEESVEKAREIIYRRREEAERREESAERRKKSAKRREKLISKMPPLPKTFHRAYSADDAQDVANGNKKLEESVKKADRIRRERIAAAEQKELAKQQAKEKIIQEHKKRLNLALDLADEIDLFSNIDKNTLTLSEQEYLKKNKNDKKTSDIKKKLESPLYLLEEPNGEQRLVVNDPEKETMASFTIKKIKENSYSLCTAAGVCLVVSLGLLFRKRGGGKRNTTRKAGVKKNMNGTRYR